MRINSKKYKGLFITLVAVLFMLSMGITYAYFSLGVNGNENAKNVTLGTDKLEIKFTDGIEIIANDIEPRFYTKKTITVKNTGTLPVYYDLLWDELYNEITYAELLLGFDCKSDIASCSSYNTKVIQEPPAAQNWNEVYDYELLNYYDGDEEALINDYNTEFYTNFTSKEEIIEHYKQFGYDDYKDYYNDISTEFYYEYDIGASVPFTNGLISEDNPIKSDIFIIPGETQTIDLTLYFKETNDIQDYNQGKTFNGKLKVSESGETTSLYIGPLTPVANMPGKLDNDRDVIIDENGGIALHGIEEGEHSLYIYDYESDNEIELKLTLEFTNQKSFTLSEDSTLNFTSSVHDPINYWAGNLENDTWYDMLYCTHSIYYGPICDMSPIDKSVNPEQYNDDWIRLDYLVDGDNVDSIIVPSNISGLPVKEVYVEKNYNLSDKTNINYMYLPDTVANVDYFNNLNTDFKINNIQGGMGLEQADLPSSIEDLVALEPDENGLIILGDLLIDGSNASGDVIVPENVKYINNNAFYKNDDITSVSILGDLVRIGSWAFDGCDLLKKLEVPDSLEVIGYGAFQNSALEVINIPKNLKYIDEYAFYATPFLDNVLPNDDGLVIIGDVLYSCVISDYIPNRNVVIPDNIFSISPSAFEYNFLLDCVVSMGNNLKYIGYLGLYGGQTIINLSSNFQQQIDITFVDKLDTDLSQISNETSKIIYNGITYNSVEEFFENTNFDAMMAEYHCFVKGTQIQTSLDGETKNIEDIKIGDKVVSYDVKNKKYYYTEVTDVEENTTNITVTAVFDDRTLVFTPNHPLYTSEGFKSITNARGYKTLKVGDIVLVDGKYKELLELNYTNYDNDISVYSLNVRDYNEIFDVDSNDTFITNGVVVHNAK